MHMLYKVRITPFGPPAVVITTAFKNPGGYYKGESFSIFPEPHPGRVFTGIGFRQKTFEDSPITLTEEFMLDEALEQAKIDLTSYIQERYCGKEFPLLTGDLRFEPVNAQFLVHLHIRGAGEFLWDVENKTNCDDLKKAIGSVFNTPKLIQHRIID